MKMNRFINIIKMNKLIIIGLLFLNSNAIRFTDFETEDKDSANSQLLKLAQ